VFLKLVSRYSGLLAPGAGQLLGIHRNERYIVSMNQALKRRLFVLGLGVWGLGSFVELLRDGAVGFLGALVVLPVLLSLFVWVVLLVRWVAAALGLWKPRN
jgi:hypothetical protein